MDMMQNERNEDKNSFLKIIISMFIIVFVIVGGQFVTSAFPQTVLFDDKTTFQVGDKKVAFQKFSDKSTSVDIIKGNQIQNKQVKYNDLIAFQSNSYVRVNQNDGIFAIPTKLKHVILFEQSELSFDDDKKAVMSVGNDYELTMKPTDKENVYKIISNDMNYDIKLDVGESTYITDYNNYALYKIVHEQDKFLVSLVGVYEKKFNVKLVGDGN